jgi:hypothetical protein
VNIKEENDFCPNYVQELGSEGFPSLWGGGGILLYKPCILYTLLLYFLFLVVLVPFYFINNCPEILFSPFGSTINMLRDCPTKLKGTEITIGKARLRYQLIYIIKKCNQSSIF